jgi:hypothetical protein
MSVKSVERRERRKAEVESAQEVVERGLGAFACNKDKGGKLSRGGRGVMSLIARQGWMVKELNDNNVESDAGCLGGSGS